MTFGGVLRHINLSGTALHDDNDPRTVTVITDDERPAVFYGHTKMIRLHKASQRSKIPDAGTFTATV